MWKRSIGHPWKKICRKARPRPDNVNHLFDCCVARPIQNTLLLLGKTLQVFDTSNCHLWVFSFPVTGKKLKHLLDVYCKDIGIRIVFSSFKIKNFFQFQRSYSRCIKIYGCASIYLCGMWLPLHWRDVTPLCNQGKRASLDWQKFSCIQTPERFTQL